MYLRLAAHTINPAVVIPLKDDDRIHTSTIYEIHQYRLA